VSIVSRSLPAAIGAVEVETTAGDVTVLGVVLSIVVPMLVVAQLTTSSKVKARIVSAR
jgi:hypothetical protein